MNKKTTGIIAYITWIGWIVAFCAGDKEGAKFQIAIPEQYSFKRLLLHWQCKSWSAYRIRMSGLLRRTGQSIHAVLRATL